MTSFRSINRLFVIFCLVFLNSQGYAQEQTSPRFKAIAFDYFVIFDPNSVLFP